MVWLFFMNDVVPDNDNWERRDSENIVESLVMRVETSTSLVSLSHAWEIETIRRRTSFLLRTLEFKCFLNTGCLCS